MWSTCIFNIEIMSSHLVSTKILNEQFEVNEANITYNITHKANRVYYQPSMGLWSLNKHRQLSEQQTREQHVKKLHAGGPSLVPCLTALRVQGHLHGAPTYLLDLCQPLSDTPSSRSCTHRRGGYSHHYHTELCLFWGCLDGMEWLTSCAAPPT